MANGIYASAFCSSARHSTISNTKKSTTKFHSRGMENWCNKEMSSISCSSKVGWCFAREHGTEDGVVDATSFDLLEGFGKCLEYTMQSDKTSKANVEEIRFTQSMG